MNHRLFENIFSVNNRKINNKNYKIIRIVGIKIKILNKYKELNDRIDNLKKEIQPILRLNDFDKKSINKEKINLEIEKFKNIGITDKKRTQKLIISLTSYPERMYDIHYSIYSLLNQKLKPDLCILWLAENQFPNKEQDLPTGLLNLKKNGLTIKWCTDLKSYKKLIPAIQMYPNDIIITADDDLYYASDWLEKLYQEYLLSDKNCIIAHRAHRIEIKNKQILPYSKWKKCINIDSKTFLNFPTSGGGILYPPASLHTDVINSDLFMQLAPNADDIWFWAMGVLNNKKTQIVKNPNMIVYTNHKREFGFYNNEQTLYSTNKNQNDIQIKNIIENYPDIKNILIENNIKVSIILPVFNLETHLKQCLNDLTNQTLKEIEIICINDGSTDNSLEILKKYAKSDNRIKIINIANSGAAAARDLGLKIAQGEYVGFMDGDDRIDLNFYETLYNKALNTGADIARCTYKYKYPHNKLINSEINRIIEKRAADNQNLNINEHSCVIWNAIYNLNFLKRNNINFDQNLKMCHDIPFTTKADFLSNKTIPVVGTNYYYTKTRKGQLITPSIDRLKFMLESNIIVAEFLNSLEDINEKDYINAYQRILNRFSDYYKKYCTHKLFNNNLESEFNKTYQRILKECKYPPDIKSTYNP